MAGIIAIRRQELDVARRKLEEARDGNPGDCETSFYLQAVLAEQRNWPNAAGVAAAGASCFDAAEVQLRNQIDSLRASMLAADRKAGQITRRERQIAAGARMRATCWFNAAVSNFNLSRRAEAASFAERVKDDDQFGERAREVLMRLRGLDR